MDKKEKVPFYAGVAKKTSKKPVPAEKEKHIDAKAGTKSKKTFSAKNGKQAESFSE